jgi:hypothetical protein
MAYCGHGQAADAFMRDLSGRLANRVQLTSDGHKAYLNAVERHFGNDIDYAMLVKHYGPAPEQSAARRYSTIAPLNALERPLAP